jgi:hypothetical protein
VESLIKGFQDADELCRNEYEYPKRLSFPTAALILEEEEAAFGKAPWAHGLENNRRGLETFMAYAAAQGYTGRCLSLAESFWTESSTAGSAAMSKETVASAVAAA